MTGEIMYLKWPEPSVRIQEPPTIKDISFLVVVPEETVMDMHRRVCYVNGGVSEVHPAHPAE